VALIAAGGVLVMLSDFWGWSFTFIAAALIMAILAVTVLSFPAFRKERPPAPTRPSLWQQWVGPIRVLFQRPNFLTAVAFILSFKVGEAMLVAMSNPFWIDRGFTPGQVGLVVGTLGTMASIGGAIAG
jgi:PAT family beta-lactamase induction signal transducer AmpG